SPRRLSAPSYLLASALVPVLPPHEDAPLRSTSPRGPRDGPIGPAILTRCRLRHICATPSLATACAVASLNAIHDRSAHFTRAGYFATPANATPSSSTDSSPSTSPRPAIIAVNASTRDSASSTLRSSITSCSTLADA